MQCGIHSDREAVGMCVDCGTYICVICLNKEAGKLYCDSCAQLRALSPPSAMPQSYQSQPQSLMVVSRQKQSGSRCAGLIGRQFWGAQILSGANGLGNHVFSL